MFEKYWKVDGFVPIPHSKQNFYVNVKGEILNEVGRQVQTTVNDEGHLQFFADLWDGVRQYRVIDVVAIIFKKINIPIDLWNEVNGFPLNGDLKDIHAINVGYRFSCGPLQNPRYPEFYYIPMFTNYGIDQAGHLAYLRNDISFKQYRRTPANPSRGIKGGYVVTTAFPDVGRSSTVSRHRLKMMALTFFPDNVEKLVVNHLDGIPGNDDLDNLEWATRSRNLTHAMETGLRNDNKPVLARNVLTGEIDRYYSISECARSLDYPTDETIRNRIVNSEFSKVFFDGFQFKLEEDSRDWIIPEDPKKAVEAAKLSRPVLVKSMEDNSVTRYHSAMEAGKVISIKGGTIAYRLRNDNRQPYLGYQFKYEEDSREWLECPVEEWVTEVVSSPKAVVVRTVEGEIVYDSINEARRQHDLPNIMVYLQRNLQPHYGNGLSVRMEMDDWDDSRTEVVNGRGVIARDIETRELIEAPSSRSLAMTLNLDNKLVAKVVSTDGKCVYGRHQFKSKDSALEWSVIPDSDVKLILDGVPQSGLWKKVTDIETGEVRYFKKSADALSLLKVKGASSLFKAIKEKKLLDGRYRIESYRPDCLFNTR